jgi:PLP dependent protein
MLFQYTRKLCQQRVCTVFSSKPANKSWIMAEFSSAKASSSESESSSSATTLKQEIIIKDKDHAQMIVNNAQEVRRLIDEHCGSIGRDAGSVNLIPVSKTKPVEDIQALYNIGYRHFGENYFQELLEKASLLPNDIKWHFIGHLQSSKSARLIREVSNLHVIETVDSMKLAMKLNNGCILANRDTLDIYIQIDTSGEDTKSGIQPSELSAFIEEIQEKCDKLNITGLMTIGAPGDLICFDRLVECAHNSQNLINNKDIPLELSMGMSGDYTEAISRGSTAVRVGSTIFGARSYPSTAPASTST